MTARAWLGGVIAEGLVEAGDDPSVLDRGGWWAVVVTFEGEYRLWRFDRTGPAPVVPDPAPGSQPWAAIRRRWRSSLDRDAYLKGVTGIRDRIREGEVYQVNLCRVLATDERPDDDPWALAATLATGNPAPYAGVIDVPATAGLPRTRLVTASPELGLSRDGDTVASRPIKGTAPTAELLKPKDDAENVMIVDLVRNDLQRVCEPGSVEVTGLLRTEQHPGLVHLVSTVQGRLAPGTTWPLLLDAVTPPGSVSGAPKSSALTAIRELEPARRGPYCGLVGYVDADAGCASLAVGIRTFWWEHGELRFGTGAGITWGSDPEQEWDETELKARRLLGLVGREERA